MTAGNPPRNDADTRRRYTHQAYDVTYGGANMESGAAGYGRRLSATYQANFQVTIDCADTTEQVFTLPPFVYANKFVVVEGGDGSPVANVVYAKDASDPSSTVAIASAVDLSAASAADAALDNQISVEPTDGLIKVTVTTPGTGYATLLIKADIVQTSWK